MVRQYASVRVVDTQRMRCIDLFDSSQLDEYRAESNPKTQPRWSLCQSEVKSRMILIDGFKGNDQERFPSRRKHERRTGIKIDRLTDFTTRMSRANDGLRARTARV